jgi:hypothetical protein
LQNLPLILILGIDFIFLTPKTIVMNTNKFILSGIAGGIACFLLGWLSYGMLFANFFMEHAGPAKGVSRAADHMLLPYIALGNFLFGFLLAYIINKAVITTVSNGIITAAIVGFLVSSSYDSVSYGTTWISSRTSIVVDIAVFTAMSAIAGAVVAWVAGTGKKTA